MIFNMVASGEKKKWNCFMENFGLTCGIIGDNTIFSAAWRFRFNVFVNELHRYIC